MRVVDTRWWLTCCTARSRSYTCLTLIAAAASAVAAAVVQLPCIAATTKSDFTIYTLAIYSHHKPCAQTTVLSPYIYRHRRFDKAQDAAAAYDVALDALQLKDTTGSLRNRQRNFDDRRCRNSVIEEKVLAIYEGQWAPRLGRSSNPWYLA